MKTRLLIITILLVLLTTLLMPSIVYAKDPVKLDTNFQFVEELGKYKIYKNDKTKEYKFEEGFVWFWEDYDIPIQYQPTDKEILKLLNKEGVNPKKVHISRDYSPEHPSTITYQEYDTDNYVSLITQLPQVTNDGELIDCKWGTVGNVFRSGNNWFEAEVSQGAINITSNLPVVM